MRSRWFAERMFLRRQVSLEPRDKRDRKQLKRDLEHDINDYLARGGRIHVLPGTPERPAPRV